MEFYHTLIRSSTYLIKHIFYRITSVYLYIFYDKLTSYSISIYRINSIGRKGGLNIFSIPLCCEITYLHLKSLIHITIIKNTMVYSLHIFSTLRYILTLSLLSIFDVSADSEATIAYAARF